MEQLHYTLQKLYGRIATVAKFRFKKSDLSRLACKLQRTGQLHAELTGPGPAPAGVESKAAPGWEGESKRNHLDGSDTGITYSWYTPSHLPLTPTCPAWRPIRHLTWHSTIHVTMQKKGTGSSLPQTSGCSVWPRAG